MGALRGEQARLPRPTDRLPLGTSGLEVSPFCLGMIPDGSPDTVLAAYDAGINFFFVSADMHWPYYETLRQGLVALLARGGGIRDRIVVAAASYVAAPVFLHMPFVEVLESTPGLERIDVCVAGGCFAFDPPERRAAMLRHRERRHVGCRAAGASFHARELAAPAHDDGALDAIFIRYNTLHPGARQDIFPLLRPSSTLLYGFKAMMRPSDAQLDAIADLPEGTWRPRPADHYRFALSSPLDGLLCTLQTPDEIQQLVDAMAEGPLDADEQAHMIDLALLASGQAQLLPDEPGIDGSAPAIDPP